MSPRDALGEIATLGASRAVEALQAMTGRPASVAAASVGGKASLDGLVDLSGPGVLVRLDIASWGALVVLFDDASARCWVAVLTGAAPDDGAQLDHVERSALAELANILGSHFLDAMSRSLRRPMLPSPPSLRTGELATLLRDELEGLAPQVVATNRFEAQGGGGRFVLARGAWSP